jgi:N-acetylglucosamine transport system substrate-binding protein
MSPNTLSRRSALRAAAAGLAALPFAAACATSGGDGGNAATGTVSSGNPLGVDPGAPLEVDVFKGGYGDDYAKFDEGLYTKRYPKAAITHKTMQSVQEELQPRFVAGNPPDVVDNEGAEKMIMGSLAGQNQLADLAPLLSAPSLDDPGKKVSDTLLPGVLDGDTFNGKVLSLNYVYTAFGIWYSESLFQKKGWQWPATWDGLLALCDEMTKAGMSPFVYGGQNAADYLLDTLMSLAAKQGGPDVLKNIDNLNAGAWTAEPVRNAANAISQLAKKGYFMPGSEGMIHTVAQTAWVQGKAGLYASGSWIENEMKGITPDGFNMVFGAVPRLSDSDKMPVAAIHGDAEESYIVPAKAHNVRGGMDYLRTMLSKQAAAKFSELTHAPTIVKDATGDQDFGSSAFGSVIKAIAAAGPNTFTFLFSNWYATLNKFAFTEIGNLLAGRTDANGFVTAMQGKADDVAKDSTVTKFQR